MRLQVLKNWFLIGMALVFLLVVSVFLQLDLPAPTGPYAVGQTVFRWEDPSRPEELTDDPNDFREVIALIWYPAEGETGTTSPYFPELSTVSNALVESGEVEPWAVFGLQLMRSQNLLNANPVKNDVPYPILILSPGNATNIEFYNTLASEIASHGYIVVGINHPYDVAAVELSNHDVAQYYKEHESLEMRAHQAFIAERIKVRTEDVLFAFNQLRALNSGTNNLFSSMLDLETVAVAGHSLGGITASESCKAETRFRACLNFDGLQRGGPFSMEESAIPPDQPFMFMTKESKLHPQLIEKFESTLESYWVVIHGTSHDSFTDGPLLQPQILPIPNRADQIAHLIQTYTLAFLDQTLKGQRSHLLTKSFQLQDVSVQVYPST